MAGPAHLDTRGTRTGVKFAAVSPQRGAKRKLPRNRQLTRCASIEGEGMQLVSAAPPRLDHGTLAHVAFTSPAPK